jgi:murein DD-endopeptidase MepM/ murein hydrolase activator NlpD
MWHWLKKQKTRIKLRRRGSFIDSTGISLLFRPWLERDRVKTWLSVPVFAVVAYTGVSALPETQEEYFGWQTDEPIATVLSYNPTLPKEGDSVTYMLPVAVLSGVSQNYHSGHPGVDFMAPRGSQIIAMERGTVESVTLDTFGYGHHVYITHLYGVRSLYAHMQNVWVKPGVSVDPGQAIGTIGTTGWSTGPHLHFEVYEGEIRVNPIKYVGESLKWARGQVKN